MKIYSKPEIPFSSWRLAAELTAERSWQLDAAASAFWENAGGELVRWRAGQNFPQRRKAAAWHNGRALCG